MCGLQSWPHPLNCVCACLWLLFEGGYYAELLVQLLIYIMATNQGACGFYSNKYGMHCIVWISNFIEMFWQNLLTATVALSPFYYGDSVCR